MAASPEARKQAVELARKMLTEGSIYTFAAYGDARRLAEWVLAQEPVTVREQAPNRPDTINGAPVSTTATVFPKGREQTHPYAAASHQPGWCMWCTVPRDHVHHEPAEGPKRDCPDCHGSENVGSYDAPVPCGRCQASGVAEAGPEHECVDCGGDGYTDPRQSCPSCGHEARVARTCVTCGGTGKAATTPVQGQS